jgi:predicted amidophosphoribosyltransferase
VAGVLPATDAFLAPELTLADAHQPPQDTAQDLPKLDSFCHACGKPLLPQARFCSACGQAV